MVNQLSALKELTTVVADTGDVNNIKQYSPQDATTNPSLILKAAQDEACKYIFDRAISKVQDNPASIDSAAALKLASLNLAVGFGVEILKLIPGKVSTEIDARLSFDTQATVAEARQIIKLYKQNGVDSSRVLLKIASTWEGVQAAKVLQEDGLGCNMTLVFNSHQAIACAQVGATLISPFVGRISDWYKSNASFDPDVTDPSLDPGVVSVRNIYNYFHKFSYPTIVMGASFRSIAQIKELAGCDYLTISPDLLSKLQQQESNLEVKLSDEQAKSLELEKINVTEKSFRWSLNEDAMASEKLADGIRRFAVDANKLDKLLQSALAK